MSVLLWTAVAVLGGVGSVLRFLVDGQVSTRLGRLFPFGTLVVNLSGAVLLGLVAGLAWSGAATLLVGTAVVGSYTTFSTWMFESQRLAEDRQLTAAAANVLVSLLAGVVAAGLGRLLAGMV
jgi:CrcB protein